MNVRIEKFDTNVNTNMTMSLNMNIPCVNLQKTSPTSRASKIPMNPTNPGSQTGKVTSFIQTKSNNFKRS